MFSIRFLLCSAVMTLCVFTTASQAASKFSIPGSSVTASTYDTDNNAVPANAVDGSLSTRWAGEGDGAHITFDLGAIKNVQYVKIAFYHGDSRTQNFDVLCADASSGPWTTLLSDEDSSGNTNSLQTFDFTDTNARYVRIVGHDNSTGNGWNSLTEVEVWGTDAQVAAPDFSPAAGTYSSAQNITISTSTSDATIRYTTDGSTPTSSSGNIYSSPVAISTTTTLKAIAYKSGLSNSSVTAGVYTISSSSATKFSIPGSSVTASTYDTNNNAVPANAVDGNLSTRWAGQGDGAYITFDLGAPQSVDFLKIAFHQGDTRTQNFDVLCSNSLSGSWTTLLSGTNSSGTTTALQTFNVTDTSARYVRIVGHGNSSGNGWNSLTEVEIWGVASSQVAAPNFNPGGGVYSTTQSVTISSTTTGAMIRYTTNGSTPTSSSGTIYSSPVSISSTTTLKAIAYKLGMSDSAVTSASYTIGLDVNAPPCDNFDLSKWKLTKPDGNEISVASLNNDYELTNRFYTDPVTGGMVFRCGNSEGTTGGSSYSRCELREMLSGTGSTTASSPVNNWYLSTTSSIPSNAGGVDGTLRATLSVDRVSTTGDSGKVGRVIVGQIHASSDEPCRLYYHKRPSDSKGAIYFAHEPPTGSEQWWDVIGGKNDLDPSDGIELGEVWSYEIKADGLDLTVTIKRPGKADVVKQITMSSGFNGDWLYFKAGVYNQNNTGSTDPDVDYAQATFYSLEHVHP